MVCAKCEAAERSNKTTSLAVTDVWKASGSGSDQRNERKIGGNKLLEAKKKYTTVIPVAGSSLAKRGAGTGVGATRRGASATEPFGKCKVCRVTVAKQGAVYCQKCAFKEGKCVLCEAKILDTSQYKMSAK